MIKEISYKKATKREHKELNNDQNPFRKDHSRILYSVSFRILGGKTQVMPIQFCPNFMPRTRAQHSLEVSETSKRVAKKIGLNEDAADTIALGHDLGHIIGGHAGEAELNKLVQEIDEEKRFGHDIQGDHVITHFEYIKHNFLGLNPTALIRHSLNAKQLRSNVKMHTSKSERIKLDFDLSNFQDTLEGQLVSIIDKVVYLVHDFEDAYFAQILNINNIRDFPIIKQNWNQIKSEVQDLDNKRLLMARIKSHIYYTFYQSLIEQNKQYTKIINPRKFYLITTQLIDFDAKVKHIYKDFKQSMYDRVYHGLPCRKRDEIFAKKVKLIFDVLYNDRKLLTKHNYYQVNLNQEIPWHQIVTDVIWSWTEHMADSFIRKIMPDFFKEEVYKYAGSYFE